MVLEALEIAHRGGGAARDIPAVIVPKAIVAIRVLVAEHSADVGGADGNSGDLLHQVIDDVARRFLEAAVLFAVPGRSADLRMRGSSSSESARGRAMIISYGPCLGDRARARNREKTSQARLTRRRRVASPR